MKARNSRRVDWEAWTRRAERALDVANRGDWRGLFAPQATFGDPHTPSTNDLRSISQQSRRIFPDWTQEITRIRGAETWAVFEWIGRGTFSMPDAPGTGTRITMHGATIVEVNAQGTPVLLVEQNANKALEIAHRGFVLETGSIVQRGTGRELLASEDVQKAYLGM